MELKLVERIEPAACPHLLIVPYGIETAQGRCYSEAAALLIVPYGIETFPSKNHTWTLQLLIVPYGIETVQWHGTHLRHGHF